MRLYSTAHHITHKLQPLKQAKFRIGLFRLIGSRSTTECSAMLCYAVCVIESNRSFGTWTGAYVIALILSCHRLLMEFFSLSLLTLSISEGKKREEKKTHYEAGKDRYLPSYHAPLLYVCVCVLGLHLWSLTHPHHLELNIYCIYVHCMRENNLKFKEDFCCI